MIFSQNVNQTFLRIWDPERSKSSMEFFFLIFQRNIFLPLKMIYLSGDGSSWNPPKCFTTLVASYIDVVSNTFLNSKTSFMMQLYNTELFQTLQMLEYQRVRGQLKVLSKIFVNQMQCSHERQAPENLYYNCFIEFQSVGVNWSLNL